MTKSRSIPSHYTGANLGMVSTETMIAIVTWIMDGTVLGRGVMYSGVMSLNGNHDRSTKAILWGIYRDGLVMLSKDGYDALYETDFWFADERDAVEFKLRFTE